VHVPFHEPGLPELLKAVDDTLRPDRVVMGVDAERSEKTLREVYAQIVDTGTSVVVTDFATAELIKVAANAFLATKISFINAMAEICEVVGADVTQLADAIGHDARIGRRFLDAWLGFGGGCLPKDIRAFMARAGELGVDQALAFQQAGAAVRVYDPVAMDPLGPVSRRAPAAHRRRSQQAGP
jgi:UDPglucose 6-dehydrogenase